MGNCHRVTVMLSRRCPYHGWPSSAPLFRWLLMAVTVLLGSGHLSPVEGRSLREVVDANGLFNSAPATNNGFDTCYDLALQGHCDFYSCLDEVLQCVGSKHNRSVAYRFCDMSRHHGRYFTKQGRRWARATNRCVLKALAASPTLKREEWCSQVDGATKEALLECASMTDICRVLWTDREALHQVFSTGSWLTIVEAAKQCPRPVVNNFIFWTLHRMHIY